MASLLSITEPTLSTKIDNNTVTENNFADNTSSINTTSSANKPSRQQVKALFELPY